MRAATSNGAVQASTRIVPGLPKRKSLSRNVTAHARGTAVVTREAGKNGALIAMLAERDIDALELPLIGAAPGPQRDELPALLRRGAFDWVALTSPEAAAVFIEGWRAAGRPPVRIASVGTGTSRILEEAPEADALRPAFAPSKANAVHFSAELPLGPADGRRILYPASAKARTTLQDGLAARGFAVTRLDTYDTLAVSDASPELLAAARRCDVVCIASPSALRAWIGLVGLDHARRMPVACIGSTSGEAALRAGLERDMVFWEDPGLEGFVNATERALNARCVSQ